MIPNSEYHNIWADDLKLIQDPTRTYCMDLENRRMAGFCDGLTAVKQAVYKMLQTERFEELIYSENYGLQVKDLFGQDSSVVEAVLAGRIAEALQMDERITAVSGFTFTRSRESLHVAFTVTSTEGSFPAEVTMII
ncbi:MAG: DUF2634 domain-containing protein [Clostridiales bacterium]|nr:DUF2634 domain-containing protein [Clostridiales bacterium]